LKSAICNQAQRGAGFTVKDIFQLNKIDRWFLTQMKEIVDFQEELAGTNALPDGAGVATHEHSSQEAFTRRAGDCRR
jgi:hypothetical protein